jgi:hypothetical protein
MGFIDEELIYYRLHDDQITKIIWQERDFRRNELFEAIINDDIDTDPLFYHRYWKHREKAIDLMLKEGFHVSEEAVKEVKRRKKTGLITFLRKYNYFKRKRNLFSLWLRGKEHISFSDFLYS